MMRLLPAMVAAVLYDVNAAHTPMPKDIAAARSMLESQLKRWVDTRL